MGPNVLWLTEALTDVLTLEQGMRVLDLGCGRALNSIFLAREFGVQVWAADLWITPWDNWQRIVHAGVGDPVFPIHAEAHRLPLATGFFDVVVNFDANHYFGTDDFYIGYIARFLKPGGRLGIVVPPLTRELNELPPELAPHWSWDIWSFHGPEWWRRRWNRSGLVDVQHADLLPDGWRHWVQSDRGSGYDREAAGWVAALEADAGRTFGFHAPGCPPLRCRFGSTAVELIEYRRNQAIDNDEYNQLRLRAWGRENGFDWSPVLARSLGWITAHVDGCLIGFVNVAWDGAAHMFLLDTTVDPAFQRRGIGSELVRRALEIGAEAGGDWMHVDSDEVLVRDFYGPCGFTQTPAGLANLRDLKREPDAGKSASLQGGQMAGHAGGRRSLQVGWSVDDSREGSTNYPRAWSRDGVSRSEASCESCTMPPQRSILRRTRGGSSGGRSSDPLPTIPIGSLEIATPARGT